LPAHAPKFHVLKIHKCVGVDGDRVLAAQPRMQALGFEFRAGELAAVLQKLITLCAVLCLRGGATWRWVAPGSAYVLPALDGSSVGWDQILLC